MSSYLDGSLTPFLTSTLSASSPDDVNNYAGWFRDLAEESCWWLGHEPDDFCGGADEYQAFDGQIDELKLWSVVRTPAEIAASFNLPHPAGTPNLVAYFTFDEPELEPSASSDQSGNANQLVLGKLPSKYQWLTYSTGRPSGIPTKPDYATSGAPIVAGSSKLRVYVHTNQSYIPTAPQHLSVKQEIRLLAVDVLAPNSTLTIRVESLPATSSLPTSAICVFGSDFSRRHHSCRPF